MKNILLQISLFIAASCTGAFAQLDKNETVEIDKNIAVGTIKEYGPSRGSKIGLDNDGTMDDCGMCNGDNYFDIDSGLLQNGDCDCDGNILDECGLCGGSGCYMDDCETYPALNYDCDGDYLSIFDSLIPDDYTLHSIYPNPFNPITNIIYGIPEYSNVHIKIYDISGRLIETIFKGYVEAGYHQYTWNAKTHSSGVYLIQINYGKQILKKKIILMK